MARYLVDVNLPSRFALWWGKQYEHVRDHNDEWTDSQVWSYARQHSLSIITKDADFSDRVLVSEPPPRVIHIRLGNMTMSDFHRTLSRSWPEVLSLSSRCRLVRVFRDRLEGVE